MRKVIEYFLRGLFAIFPETRCFGLKNRILRNRGFDVCNDVKCCSSARFLMSGQLKVGRGTWLGSELLVIGGDADVVIGEKCDVGPRVTLVTGTHEVLIGQDRVAGRGFSKPIVIGDGCWLGANSVILGGSEIGECSIIGAGAVVAGSFPARSLIGGVPAKLLRNLGERSE